VSEEALAIAGLVIGVLGIAVSIVTYFWTRERKRLDYEVIINAPLMGREARIFQEDLEVRFRGAPVTEPHLVIIRLVNTGNRPIAPDDQVENILIDFAAPRVRLINADVIRTNIQKEKISLTIQGDAVSLMPYLFNQGDWVAFRMLVDGKGSPVVAGRISGVRTIGRYRAPSQIPGELGFLVGFGAMTFWIFTLYDLVNAGSQVLRWLYLFGVIGSFGLAWLLWVLLLSRPRRRRAEAMRVTFD
jgi:hypothetical protein